GAVAGGAGDHQGAAPGRPAAGVVPAPQAAEGGEHRRGRGDAEAGHGHLAHAEQAQDLRRVPGHRGGRGESKEEAGERHRGGREGDLALGCQSRMEEGGLVPPHSVLAPGTALGLLPSRALPSAQARGMVVARKALSNRTGQRGDERDHAAARLFDPGCPRAARDPSRWGQLEMCPGCGGLGPQGPVSAARCFGWSGPDGEEFARDKSASAAAEGPAEPLTAIVGGSSRRNVLGAIAAKRTIATSRSEATTTESEPDHQTTVRARGSLRPTNPGKTRRPPSATVTEPPQREATSA